MRIPLARLLCFIPVVSGCSTSSDGTTDPSPTSGPSKAVVMVEIDKQLLGVGAYTPSQVSLKLWALMGDAWVEVPPEQYSPRFMFYPGDHWGTGLGWMYDSAEKVGVECVGSDLFPCELRGRVSVRYQKPERDGRIHRLCGLSVGYFYYRRSSTPAMAHISQAFDEGDHADMCVPQPDSGG